MSVYLETQFQVSSIILTSFRQGVIFPSSPLPLPQKPTPKKPTYIRVKESICLTPALEIHGNQS